jgi:hypothetical protein
MVSQLLVVGVAAGPSAYAACAANNVCFGNFALENNIGQWNSAFGLGAAAGEDTPFTGSFNTALGANALVGLSNGNHNTATGYRALAGNSTEGAATVSGSRNTATGAFAIHNYTVGNDNTGVGYKALRGGETTYNADTEAIAGSRNTGTGANALFFIVSGNDNTATGFDALNGNSDASFNTATGAQALKGRRFTNTDDSIYKEYFVQSGSYNTATGFLALNSNYTGAQNTAIGNSALAKNSAGNNNTASGAFSLTNNTSGIANTAAGFEALRANTSGKRNTAFGINALGAVTTGTRNVAVGAGAGKSSTGSDNVLIGAENFGVAGENGVIRIGTSTYQKKAFVAGVRGVTTGGAGAVAVLIDANGQLGTVNSSRKFKEDIEPMGDVSERLFALRPVTFRYQRPLDDGSKPVQFGLVAEEVAEAFPELVAYDEDGQPETVSYHLLATLLLNELQKEHRVNQAQSERIALLEGQAAEVAALKEQIASMTKVLRQLDSSELAANDR